MELSFLVTKVPWYESSSYPCTVYYMCSSTYVSKYARYMTTFYILVTAFLSPSTTQSINSEKKTKKWQSLQKLLQTGTKAWKRHTENDCAKTYLSIVPSLASFRKFPRSISSTNPLMLTQIICIFTRFTAIEQLMTTANTKWTNKQTNYCT